MVPGTDDEDDDESEPPAGDDPGGTEGEGPNGTGDEEPDGTDDSDGGAGGADADVDSRWWYWVAAVPLYWVASSVVGFAFTLVALAFALTGAGVGHATGVPGLGVGFGALGIVGVALLLVAAGMVLSLAFPVAIYLDAEAVGAVASDWQPDPALYGLVGLAGVVAQPLQVPLAVYYLYKRHESLGRP